MLGAMVWILGVSPILAQDNGQPVEVQRFDEDSWRKHTDGLDYQRVKPQTTRSQRNRSDGSGERKKKEDEYKPVEVDQSSGGSMFSLGGGGFLQYVFAALAIIAIVFLIVMLVGKDAFISNKKIKKGAEFDLENMDEDELRESDLMKWLRKSLENKNYKLGLRIYYLMVIKELVELGWIKWQKEKTNGQYLREMRKRPNYKAFFRLTRIFEYVWYGDKQVKEASFNKVSGEFKDFLSGLNTNAK